MSIANNSWGSMLDKLFKENGDSHENILGMAPANLDLHRTFNSGWGGSNGKPFTIWTEKYVYFPGVYDGSEWIAFVRRHPCDVATQHVGE